MNVWRRAFVERSWQVWRSNCYIAFVYVGVAFLWFVAGRYFLAGLWLALAASYMALAYSTEARIKRMLA